MSQNDYVIANQTTPLFRADLNSALQALTSNSSGATAPATTYANMLWYDTATNILKMRSEADDAWIDLGYLDQSSNAFRIFDDTQVVNTSGTQTGLIGDQATATWQAGTGTTESLVSPAKVKAAVDAVAENALKLDAISAGSSVKISSDSEKSTNSTSASVILGVIVVNTGVLRLSFRQKGGSFSTSCIVDVRLNGSLTQSFSTTSSTYVSRTIDITISAPTNLTVDLRGSSTQDVFVDQVRLSTGGETLWPLSGFGIEEFVE